MIKQTLVILLLSFTLHFSQENSNDEVNSPSYNFILENLDGDLVELNEEIGAGPIILSFWATWCKPCKEELIEYNKIYNKYSDDGLKIFAISVDNEKSISKVKPYIKTNRFDFTVLLDPNSEVARKYYAQMVPYSVVLNESGKIIYSHLGYKKGDEIEVEKIVKEVLTSKK